MPNFLGEFPTIVQKTPAEWALCFITRYGGIDGEHHKSWVLDQVTRVLNNTPVITTVAKWGDDFDHVTDEADRFQTAPPSQEYIDFVKEANCGEDGPDTYTWEEGIPP